VEECFKMKSVKEILDAKLDLSMEIMDLEYDKKVYKSRLEQLYIEMEEDAEPEGGPICDEYADAIHNKEQKIEELSKLIDEKEKELDELENLI